MKCCSYFSLPAGYLLCVVQQYFTALCRPRCMCNLIKKNGQTPDSEQDSFIALLLQDHIPLRASKLLLRLMQQCPRGSIRSDIRPRMHAAGLFTLHDFMRRFLPLRSASLPLRICQAPFALPSVLLRSTSPRNLALFRSFESKDQPRRHARQISLTNVAASGTICGDSFSRFNSLALESVVPQPELFLS